MGDLMRKFKWPFAPIMTPIIDWLPNYTKAIFMNDLNAGITVFVLLIPQGMAYALVAGLPTVYGLYSSIVPLFVYAIVGTSHQISMGPMAITSLLLGVSCQKFGYEDGSDEYVAVAMNISMLVGFTLFIVGVCRLGTLVNLISHSVLVGFISASATVILINQLKYLFGLKVPRFTYIVQTVWYILTHLQDSNGYAVALGFSTWAVLLGIRKWKQHNKKTAAAHAALIAAAELDSQQQLAPHPKMGSFACRALAVLGNGSNFIAIIVGLLIARSIILSGGSISVVGVVPSGFKSPGYVSLDMGTIFRILPDALAIAFVSFAGNWAIAKQFAATNNYEIDATQELIAEGLTNIIGVVFNAFVVSGGLARSAVNSESGAKTQIASCITALCILIALSFFTSYLFYIPMASLGAVIEVSTVPLIDYKQMIRTYHADKRDFAVMMTTFLVTLLVGVSEGLFVGVLVSIVLVMQKTAFPSIVHMGKVMDEDVNANPDSVSDSKSAVNPLIPKELHGPQHGHSSSAGSALSTVFDNTMKNPVDDSDLARASRYQDVERFPQAVQLPGVAIIRMDASLYFANCSYFKDAVKESAKGAFHNNTRGTPIRLVVVDASAWVDLDLSGMTVLFELLNELKADGVQLSIANAKGVIRDRFRHALFIEALGETHLCSSIDDAIQSRPRRGSVAPVVAESTGMKLPAMLSSPGSLMKAAVANVVSSGSSGSGGGGSGDYNRLSTDVRSTSSGGGGGSLDRNTLGEVDLLNCSVSTEEDDDCKV